MIITQLADTLIPIPMVLVRFNLPWVARQYPSKEAGWSVMMVIKVGVRKLKGGIGRTGKLNNDSYAL